jgi:nucleoside-diphosphate-sugar epimerase
MSKKILVFGGNKFLGKHLLTELKVSQPQAQIFALTRSGGIDQAGVTQITCDRTDQAALKAALAGHSFDQVFDLSAYKLTDLQASLSVLKGRVKSWALVSSAGVYASSQVYPLQWHFPKVTAGPHVGKLECEEALKRVEGLHSFCIRPLYIYGPNNTFAREAYFFKAIEEEQTIFVPGDAKALLQFAQVGEVASLLAQLANLPQAQTNGRAFHVAHKSLHTVKHVLELCGKIVGEEPKIKYFDAQTAKLAGVEARDVFPLRAEHYFADLDDLHALGLSCQTDLLEGLKETYSWFGVNRELYCEPSISEAGRKLLGVLK